ncbi:unnamed protein product [Lactuca virosa]|uniref:NHL domain-containing protein n=1 Tax=Lactuca virosa TaxID=75947 RepID=A0AAU9M9S4_9ASTR|nr:unnamed protein product [Lactuca virosa]
MTEYVAVLPFMKFPVYGNSITELSFMPNGLCAQTRRKCYAACGRATQNHHKPGGFCITNLKVNHKQKVKSMKCYCLGTLISTNGDPSVWIPVIDQVLLMSSIFLTHMAGVIPADGPFSTSRRNKSSDNVAPDGTPISGSGVKNDKGKEVTLELSWDTVENKIINSITAIEHGTKLENETMESGQTANKSSSLSAIAEGPRFRLMLASFHWLKNEVDNIYRNTSTPDMKNLQKVFSEILQRSSLSICTNWLKEELLLRNKRSMKELPLRLFEKLKGDDSVVQMVKKSGKEDLYTELLYILRFDSVSQDSRYDDKFFGCWGVSVLEDLVITLSDGIASIYLELISVDSDMSNDINDLGLNLCTLSTRALQRLRNEVSLNQWFVQNMETVVSMYEDRFDLRVLESQRVLESSKGNSGKFDWLKKIGVRKSTALPLVSPLLCYAVISCVRVPVKRTKELRSLVGWRYYFSLYLELSDIGMPFVRTVAAKISDAVSFFLVCLIGRSLGLIYTGIRQSLSQIRLRLYNQIRFGFLINSTPGERRVVHCYTSATMVMRSVGRWYHILRNYQTSRRVVNSVALYSCRKINNDGLIHKQHTHRFSTVPESCRPSPSEVDLLSTFIRSSLNELEGPSHCWLNRSTATKDLTGKNGVFLVVAGAFLESGHNSTFMFEKVKSLQQRHPSLNVMGFQFCKSVSSDVVRSHLAKTIMSEYITFPILVSNKSLSEMSNKMGYIIFKGMEGPLLLHDKDVDFEILETAIKELIVQQKEKPGLLHNLRGSWVKPLDALKEPYLCSPLQNLLLYFPGCIEVDEVNERLFLSDTNHHRIIVFDGNGKILDCIGSSPGFEDGEFESSKIIRPAALFYHNEDDYLYFVDSENHAIRRADMESRTVETLYPKPNVNETKSGLVSWIIDKLWSTKDVPLNSEEVDPKLLFYPWHLLKSLENDLLILNRSFETLWILDLSSGIIKEVVKGSANIIEICGQLIKRKSSLVKEIPPSQLPQNNFSVEGISHAGLLSSVAAFQDNIVICDTDGQVVLKYNKTCDSMTSFEFSNIGMLGLPYWLVPPMESAYAAGFGVSGLPLDHIQHFSLLPGRIDIRMKVEIPQDTELVEPLDEACIWRQTRGTATETLGAENKAESTEKVGVAQQWYDELDELASLTQKQLDAEEDKNMSDSRVQDGNVFIDCAVNTSPGTSEVIINAALYLRLKNGDDSKKKQEVGRLIDALNLSGKGWWRLISPPLRGLQLVDASCLPPHLLAIGQ